MIDDVVRSLRELSAEDKKKVEEVVEKELEWFDSLWDKLGNSLLLPTERALLRTYLIAAKVRDLRS